MAVDNAKKVIKLICDGVGAVISVAADGKFGLDDLPAIIALCQEIGSDMSSFGPALAEIKALDLQGIEDLAAELAADLTMASPKIKAIIQAAAELIPALIHLVGAIKQ